MSRNQVATESVVASLCIAAVVVGIAYSVIRPLAAVPQQHRDPSALPTPAAAPEYSGASEEDKKDGGPKVPAKRETLEDLLHSAVASALKRTPSNLSTTPEDSAGESSQRDKDLIFSAASKLHEQVLRDFKGDIGALKAQFGSAVFLWVNEYRAEGGFAILMVDMMDYARKCMTSDEHRVFKQHCGASMSFWFSADGNSIDKLIR